MGETKRQRYKLNNVNSNMYYQMPKFLFAEEFINLSSDAKVLYSLLKDRHELSLMNNWVDENNNVYLIFKRKDMANILQRSQPFVRKVINELKSYGLLEEERIGLNKANRIYLTLIDIETYTAPRSETEFHSGMKHNFTQEGNGNSSLLYNKNNFNKNNFNNYIPQHKNFDQREYTDEEYEQFYSNKGVR